MLLTDTLSIDNGFLTPTLKVKRKQVLEHYKAHVSAVFGHSGAGDGAKRVL